MAEPTHDKTQQQNSIAVGNDTSIGTSGNATHAAPTYGITSNSDTVQRQEADPAQGTVTAGRLNVRSGPGAENTKVRTINRNDSVDILEERDGWIRISDNGEWVSATYIRRVETPAERTEGEALPTSDLASNPNSRAHNRWTDDGEESTYAANFQENIDDHIANFFGEGITQADAIDMITEAEQNGNLPLAEEYRRNLFLANQAAVIETLDVENDAKYSPGGGKTYCNIYTYDFVTAMGAYLPRVWWYDSAIERLENGESVTPRYGKTVHEMNANATTDWMYEYGGDYGWEQAENMETAQEEANSGKIVIILAANANRRKSGHVAVLLAETDQEMLDESDMPMTSQAGSTNFERQRPSLNRKGKAWWENSSHDRGAAWIYNGTINSPILTPQELGGHENNMQGVDSELSLDRQVGEGTTLTFGNYLDAVSQLEAAATAEGYTTQATLSAFRKLYYNSGNWNTVIAGARQTGIPSSWQNDENLALMNSVKNSQVLTINGTQVDIGHLLTGLDATNHETAFSMQKFGLDVFSFRSNKEVATYVGDLGSVVERYVDHADRNFIGLIQKDVDSLMTDYGSLAGDTDMAGNVDSYAMDFNPALSLSANLRNYYVGEDAPVNERYTRFAENIGLGSLENDNFTGDSSSFREGLENEVYTFAMAYQMREGPGKGISTWGGTANYSRASHWVVDVFIDKLKQKVQSENN